MSLLNGWVLFSLIPLYLIYKKSALQQELTKQTKLLFIVLVLMLLAMARPVFENSHVKQNFDAHDYIIALDASYSMQADDIQPSRYLFAKQAIKKLLLAHPKDRFTLFAFTSKTLLISPPTTDSSISLLALDALNPEYILTKSTSLQNLFNDVAKLPMQQKNLIIFSDGGDDHDIVKLANIAKHNNIIPYIVATATTKGAALKKNGHYIKDANEAIVISKINPILSDLANATQGKYYKLLSLDVIDDLSSDLNTKTTKKEQITVHSYQELFYIPLALALVLFFFAITNILQKQLLLLPLLFFLPQPSDAGMLDFYYLKKAKEAYKQQKYLDAAQLYAQIDPSPQSYYNIAISYYKAGHYRDALAYLAHIKTTNPQLKETILYNMGNAAAKAGHFDKAVEFYIKALAFDPEDKDALYNLHYLYKHNLTHEKKVVDLRPKTHNKKEVNKYGKNKQTDQQDHSSSNKSSNQTGSKQSSAGSIGKKKQQKSTASLSKSQKNNMQYKFTYKAYETINKGYTDEKEPW